MTELLGVLAVIGTPLLLWFTRRTTREGRLLLRIERLGTAHSLMPDSPEKTTFETHVNRLVADLNVWLDEGNRRRRSIQRSVTWTSYCAGVLAVVASLPFTDPEQPWRSTVLGTMIGLAIAATTSVSSYILARNARKELDGVERSQAAAEEAARIEALKMGLPIPRQRTAEQNS
ncbi:hypothetical protein [Salinibacterium sp. ZJ454]|uniref:hypothetical protein n=1 Tax=Salinibacterium sp. ZJ454 TaxID=2708339 RepID=UPI00141E484D|nr:hypothetical protein [Salinibacterium sp. ZJ454]